ncbi:MAG TPA: hypothetical protein VKU00_34480 [Chthonomonadaceae bacterium]|nr:hypothetical protein [Chthonomonadaceae bacterium]
MPARPHVIVILCEALTFEDIQNKECPALADFAAQSSLGVMRCPINGTPTGAAAALSLATGRMVGAVPDDVQAANDWELVPGDNNSARTIFMRRMGPLDPHWDTKPSAPEQAVKLMGVPELMQQGMNNRRLGSLLALAHPPVSAAVFGNADADTRDRSAALLTVNGVGTGAGIVSLVRYNQSAPFGMTDDPLALLQVVEESDARFIVVQFGDLARLDRAQTKFSREDKKAFRDEALRRLNIFVYNLTAGLKAEGKRADILLLASRPPADSHHFNAWNRLAPILASGPDFPPGLLTSETYGIPGLVANLDFAPTVLGLFNLVVPRGTVGKPMHTLAPPLTLQQRVAAVARMDFVAALNAQAQTDVLIPLLGVSLLLLGLGAWRRRNGAALPHWAMWVPTALLNLPAALLFAPLLVPPTLLEYGLRIAAWMAGLTILCFLAARKLRTPPASVALGIGIVTIVGDLLAGSPLQQSALFGSGSVYGGLPNVYLGWLVGSGVCLVLYYASRHPKKERGKDESSADRHRSGPDSAGGDAGESPDGAGAG